MASCLIQCKLLSCATRPTVVGPSLSSTFLWTQCSLFSPLLTKPSSCIGVLAILWLHKTFSRLRAPFCSCWNNLPYFLLSLYSQVALSRRTFLAIYVILFPDLLFFLKHLSVSSRVIYFNLFILLIIYIPQNLLDRIFLSNTVPWMSTWVLYYRKHSLFVEKWITHNWFHQNEMKLLTYSRQDAEQFFL